MVAVFELKCLLVNHVGVKVDPQWEGVAGVATITTETGTEDMAVVLEDDQGIYLIVDTCC